MIRLPPRSTRTDTLFPYTTLFRAKDDGFTRQFRLAYVGDIRLRPHFAQHVAPGRAIMRLMEEIDQCLDDSGADAINGDNLGPGSLIVMRSRGNLGKPLDRTECLQQVTRRNRADMANAKAEEETRCIRLPSRLDGGQQVFDRFLLPSFPAAQRQEQRRV